MSDTNKVNGQMTEQGAKKAPKAGKRNPEISELVFVLDRSGSMQGMEEHVIQGFNTLLRAEKAQSTRTRVSTELFSDNFQVLHNRAWISGVADLMHQSYSVGGCTALLDAIGRAIRHIAAAQRADAPEERPGRTLFVIYTDGMENASREFTRDRIRTMIQTEENDYGWEFMFLGANIDSYAEAGALGIRPSMTCDTVQDGAGMMMNFQAVGVAMSSWRTSGRVGTSWRKGIDEDYRRRGNGGRPRGGN